MAAYDYEGYFSNKSKLEHWKRKHVLDQAILAPHVKKDVATLHAGAGFFEGDSLIDPQKIVCVDISKRAVAELKKKKYRAVVADLREEWPFRDGEFEQIIMIDLFEHLGQVDTFLREVNRVCSARGMLIVGLPLLNYWKTWLKLLSGTTMSVQYDEHPRMFFDRDIKTLFSAAGFDLSHVKYVGSTKGYGYYFFQKRN